MEFTDVNLKQKFAKQNRTFSEDLKQKIVNDIEQKLVSIKDVVSLYSVTRTSIYKWIYAYSKHYSKGTKMVVELESEAEKVKQLMRRNAELERAYGLKQLEVEYLSKVIELGSAEVGFDIKKKYATRQSNISD
jgi:transposase